MAQIALGGISWPLSWPRQSCVCIEGSLETNFNTNISINIANTLPPRYWFGTLYG